MNRTLHPVQRLDDGLGFGFAFSSSSNLFKTCCILQPFLWTFQSAF